MNRDRAFLSLGLLVLACVAVVGCTKTMGDHGEQKFQGKIAKSYENSREWWQTGTAPADASRSSSRARVRRVNTSSRVTAIS